MNEDKPSKPSILQLFTSALAAFIGVQSDKNREKDFGQDSFIPYILAGIVVVALFFTVLIIIGKQIS